MYFLRFWLQPESSQTDQYFLDSLGFCYVTAVSQDILQIFQPEKIRRIVLAVMIVDNSGKTLNLGMFIILLC